MDIVEFSKCSILANVNSVYGGLIAGISVAPASGITFRMSIISSMLLYCVLCCISLRLSNSISLVRSPGLFPGISGSFLGKSELYALRVVASFTRYFPMLGGVNGW